MANASPAKAASRGGRIASIPSYLADDASSPPRFFGWGMPNALHRWLMMITATVPAIVVVVAALAVGRAVIHWYDVVVLTVMFFLPGFGITLGYHRLLAHRSYRPRPILHAALSLLGALAVQGSPIPWVSHHRKHHQFTDREGDPHSPSLAVRGGLRAHLRGLYHAHFGWILDRHLSYEPNHYAPDLLGDPFVRWLDAHMVALCVVTFLVPGLMAWALAGSPMAFWSGMFWGGAFRVFLMNHITWSVNSFGHAIGQRRFVSNDESRNVWWIALLTMGEGWHNNHHAFPNSAMHGLRWWEFDVNGLLILAFEKLRLADEVVRIPHALIVERERQLRD
jgi:stearoyl-CoA desaturase (delta-9 desaturase)